MSVILLCLFSLHYVFAYYEYTIENERVCSPYQKKKRIDLGYNERSGLVLQETRYFTHWPGTYEFHCKFDIKGISRDGIIAVVQKLDLRKNETTNECIDYLQFRAEEGHSVEKLCGKVNILQSNINPEKRVNPNVFIDLRGNLEVELFVKKQPLKNNEQIDIEIVFTAFKLCAKNPMNYSSCGSEFCIWNGFFNDGRVNCPLEDCIDESTGCAVNINGAQTSEGAVNPWYTVLILASCGLFVSVCMYMIWRKKRSAARLRRDQDGPPDFEEHLAPTAPPLPESPKDKPPSYDSLFPSNPTN